MSLHIFMLLCLYLCENRFSNGVLSKQLIDACGKNFNIVSVAFMFCEHGNRY